VEAEGQREDGHRNRTLWIAFCLTYRSSVAYIEVQEPLLLKLEDIICAILSIHLVV
jgi:hypothetical protein